ncbi:MAG: hypothetical protein LBQ42_01775 [Synergistaceae bacterium]|jgi:hypothetical protein|nr:hypothetical protein [Synergistaceae bacterium]
MKVVAAAWERRNLGLDVTEISLDRLDVEKEPETLKVLKEYMIPRRYVVVKVPTGAVAFLAQLQALGFIFLECQYSISVKLKDYVVPPRFSSLAESVSLEPLSDEKSEWLNLCRLIGDAMFTTDRIALDPLFGVDVANKRYKNWLMDMWENPSIFVTQIKYKKQNIGFFAETLDFETRTSHCLLSGLFKVCQRKGWGGSIIHGPLRLNMERKIEKFSTSISSNNLAVWRWYILFGFCIDNANYVFRYYLN